MLNNVKLTKLMRMLRTTNILSILVVCGTESVTPRGTGALHEAMEHDSNGLCDDFDLFLNPDMLWSGHGPAHFRTERTLSHTKIMQM